MRVRNASRIVPPYNHTDPMSSPRLNSTLRKATHSRYLAPSLLFLAIMVVALNAWFALNAVGRLLENEGWVQHTWQVLSELEHVMRTAKDAEASNRNYLLSGDEHALADYRANARDLPGEIDEVQALTIDNRSQQDRIVDLRQAAQRRLDLLASDAALRQNTRGTLPVTSIGNESGSEEMGALRAVAAAMEVEEERLLTTRTASTRAASARARFAIGLASALDFLLIILMFRYFAQERDLRLATQLQAEHLATSRAQIEANAAEIHELNVSLEERVRLRTAELETTNRELEAFSYSVSHDLRAPLRTIDGFSLALEEDYASAVDETGRDYIRRVRTGVQRMGQLIDALLQLSRITRAELVREQVDMTELAKAVAAELADAEPGRTIRFEIEEGLTALADAKLIRVAFENLLGNAVKFSGRVEQPVVQIGWDVAAKAWFVRDNGAGFDMYYADKLFGAFNRLHGDKDFKGSGIGLATVARVIRRHHGRIWADSTIDHGATFWFTLGSAP